MTRVLRMHMLKTRRSAMTLVELLTALVVLSMVLTGVATLAYALGSVKDSSDDTCIKQAYLRCAMVQIADRLRYARLVCYACDSEVSIWTADSNRDGAMNISEITTIHADSSGTALVISTFAAANDPQIPRASVAAHTSGWWQAYGAAESSVTVIAGCAGLVFIVDKAAPATETVSICFRMSQNGEEAAYSLSAFLRGRTGNVLADGGEIVSDDD